MREQFRVYVIGFRVPWMNEPSAAGRTAELIANVDCTVISHDGLRVGERVTSVVIMPGWSGNGKSPAEGAVLECIKLEEDGKIALLEVVDYTSEVQA